MTPATRRPTRGTARRRPESDGLTGEPDAPEPKRHPLADGNRLAGRKVAERFGRRSPQSLPLAVALLAWAVSAADLPDSLAEFFAGDTPLEIEYTEEQGTLATHRRIRTWKHQSVMFSDKHATPAYSMTSNSTTIISCYAGTNAWTVQSASHGVMLRYCSGRLPDSPVVRATQPCGEPFQFLGGVNLGVVVPQGSIRLYGDQWRCRVTNVLGIVAEFSGTLRKEADGVPSGMIVAVAPDKTGPGKLDYPGILHYEYRYEDTPGLPVWMPSVVVARGGPPPGDKILVTYRYHALRPLQSPRPKEFSAMTYIQPDTRIDYYISEKGETYLLTRAGERVPLGELSILDREKKGKTRTFYWVAAAVLAVLPTLAILWQSKRRGKPVVQPRLE